MHAVLLGIPLICLRLDPSLAAVPRIELTPAKAAYMQGEPIELRLDIYNATDQAIEFRSRGDLFNDGFIRTFSLQVGFNRQGVLARYATWKVAKALVPLIFDGMALINRITPSKGWSVGVYAQRFTGPLPLGEHELAFHLRFHYEVRFEDGRRSSREAIVEGKVRFKVIAEDPARLERILAEYFKNTQHKDQWRGYESEEALYASESPRAVPYLIELLKKEYWRPLDALGKFRNEQKAYEAVFAAFDSEDRDRRVKALRVLTDWKVDVDIRRLRTMWLKGGHFERRAVENYAVRMAQEKYLEILKEKRPDERPDP